MRASIVIAAHNEGESLWKTVHSCVETCVGLDYEILIADDASRDLSVQEGQRRFPQVRVVRHEKRQGASPTKGLGARSARGEVLIFLDGHTKPEYGAIGRLVADVEELAGTAVVTPAVPSLDIEKWRNSLVQIGHGYSVNLETFECGWLALESLRKGVEERERFYESPSLIGCALAVHRELYEKLWGFDPHIFFWGVEDLDFGLKCWLMGHPILHDPEALVGHKFRARFENYRVPFEHLVANQLRMARKNFTEAVWREWTERCRQRHPGRLTEHAEGLWARVWEIFQDNRLSCEHERSYLLGHRVYDEFWYAERFGLSWPRLTTAAAPRAAAVAALGAEPSPSPSPPPCAVLEIHPVAGDFSTGNAGKIMISALHGGGYHTTRPTTANNTPAQTQDGRIVISAYVAPVEEGLTVYFEVIDPDDPVDNQNNAYREDVSPLTSFEVGDPMPAVDGNPNDNRDPSTTPSKSMFGGTLAKYNDYQGMLSARSAQTVKRTIDNVDRAVAEVTLTLTNRYAGDNYIVRATCVDPQGKPFNDNSGVTADPGADADIPESEIKATTLLTAWKRVYIETGKMFRVGTDLTANVMAGTPDIPCDTTGLNLEPDDQVQVFDKDNQLAPFGEVHIVASVEANAIHVTNLLLDSYEVAKKAHVGKVTDANDPNFRAFYEANTPDIDGLWSHAFVEVIFRPEGSGVCPLQTALVVNTGEKAYSDDWFFNINKSNYFHMIGAHSASDGAIGGTPVPNIPARACFVYVQAIEDSPTWTTDAQRALVNRDAAAHEFTHQFDDAPVPPGLVNKHHPIGDHKDRVAPVANFNCVMNEPGRDRTRPVRWCIYHLYATRDQKEPQ